MKRIVLIFSLIILMVLTLVGCGSDLPKDSVMDIHTLSLGQADCHILTLDGKTVLIDAGEKDDGEDVVTYLYALGIKKVDVWIITHFDKDHIGGAEAVARAIQIDKLIMPTYERDSKHFKNLQKAISDMNIPTERLSQDAKLTLGKMELELFVSPLEYDGTDNGDNEQSIVTAVTYNQSRLLYMGDANGKWLQKLTLGTYNLSCDLLKVPYHGKEDASNAMLVAVTLPDYAIITDSAKNPAAQGTLDILSAIGTSVFRTMNGNIHLCTDGNSIFVP